MTTLERLYRIRDEGTPAQRVTARHAIGVALVLYRAASLTREQRSESARHAANIKWGGRVPKRKRKPLARVPAETREVVVEVALASMFPGLLPPDDE